MKEFICKGAVSDEKEQQKITQPVWLTRMGYSSLECDKVEPWYKVVHGFFLLYLF